MNLKSLHSFLLLLFLPALCFAQRRASADVEVKTVIGNNVTTVTKSVYCSNNGRLVTFFHSPLEYILDTNILGESKLYFPSSNGVFVDNSGAFTSVDELLLLALNGRLEDLGLSLSGYKLKSTEILEDGLMKKTFSGMKSELPPSCEIVYKDYLPIYSATLDAAGHVLVKVYYSKYEYLGYLPFPHRSTQIIYNSPKDSTIVRSIYSNVQLDGSDPMFDFTVPQDAQPLDMSELLKK